MQRLDYSDTGEGPPVVLLHAFPFSRAMWDADAQRCASIARVIAPDLPGFGLSPRLPQPSISRMAGAVLGLIDELRVHEPVIVGGLSMGGYVAFDMMRQAPERIRALGLFATRASADTPQQREAREALIERIRREGFKGPAQRLRETLLGSTSLASRPELAEQVDRWLQMANPYGVMDALHAMANRRDAAAMLPTLTCPALVIAGEEDTIIPVEEVRAMADRIPGAMFEMMPQSGHLVNLEQPQLFQAALERFLRHHAEPASVQ